MADKGIRAIHRDILVAPTIMSLSSELEFCHRLMEIDHSELAESWSLVSEIFERLYESHTDSIYEMLSTEDTAFFVTWLERLAKVLAFSPRRAEIGSMIDMFSCLP